MLRIESERRKRGWNQVELAFYAKVQPADISRYERGRMRPYKAHAARLARVLGLSVDELLQPVERQH